VHRTDLVKKRINHASTPYRNVAGAPCCGFPEASPGTTDLLRPLGMARGISLNAFIGREIRH
jgi:hypothetical protein